jgi:hypothetical protein
MTDAADLEPGVLVVDSDADPEQQTEAVVVNTPPVPAGEWDIGGCTVAEYRGNEPYDDSAPVVLVVYRDELAEWRSYRGAEPIPARALAAAPCRYYAFPRPRLEVVGHLDEEEADEEDDTDEHEAGDEDSTDEGDTDDSPDPPLVAIADALQDRRVSDVRVSDGAGVVEVEKLGVTYHVEADGSVREGDRVAEKLEDIARDVLGGGEEVTA